MTPEHWLNVATHGLAPASAQRVTQEYLDHLQDAEEAGEPREAVLAEWGDPHQANRELKKAHLTVREARYLPVVFAPTWQGLKKSYLQDLGFIVLMAFLRTRDVMSGADSASVGIWLLAGLLLLPLVRWIILSRDEWSLTVRAIFSWLLDVMTVMVLFIVAAMLTYRSTDLGFAIDDRTDMLTALALIAYLIYHASRLLTAVQATRKAVF
ncbi:hypothetical protein [Deinococcus radiophilus]|uniref:Uncharacterized protein n=1 Tax=Deinococcus radiophilus TaxID=32062 RepID=A0A3S0ILL3_9DEIO|nr:hypothetical protein [Deinococcus radiophilus]RTR26834.1 hypothetical protein EJ104_07500 [Deinococcus radiophilus]UFA51801.1 hypothetical protein LMT64_13190 [Deinococcus radiophilus]